MNIRFVKIEGLGNDYIFVDKKSLKGLKSGIPALAKSISNRRLGVGADGLIIIDKSSSNSAEMEIFNSDGSKAKLCGNGLRGAALYMKLIHKSRANDIEISIGEKSYSLQQLPSRGNEYFYRTNLGNPDFNATSIGLSKSVAGKDAKTGLLFELPVYGFKFRLHCLAMPNPHAVVYVKDFDFDLHKVGYAIEHAPAFRDRINVMFTRIDSRHKITVIPWERGAGATSACGSGAAAATVISTLLGYTSGDVTVTMPGGNLRNRWDIEQNIVFQEGPSRLVFSGVYKT